MNINESEIQHLIESGTIHRMINYKYHEVMMNYILDNELFEKTPQKIAEMYLEMKRPKIHNKKKIKAKIINDIKRFDLVEKLARECLAEIKECLEFACSDVQ